MIAPEHGERAESDHVTERVKAAIRASRSFINVAGAKHPRVFPIPEYTSTQSGESLDVFRGKCKERVHGQLQSLPMA